MGLLDLLAELRSTSVVALHDLNLVAMYCDRLVVLRQGRVVTVGAPGDVLTEELVARVYGVRATVFPPTEPGERSYLRLLRASAP